MKKLIIVLKSIIVAVFIAGFLNLSTIGLIADFSALNEPQVTRLKEILYVIYFVLTLLFIVIARHFPKKKPDHKSEN